MYNVLQLFMQDHEGIFFLTDSNIIWNDEIDKSVWRHAALYALRQKVSRLIFVDTQAIAIELLRFAKAKGVGHKMKIVMVSHLKDINNFSSMTKRKEQLRTSLAFDPEDVRVLEEIITFNALQTKVCSYLCSMFVSTVKLILQLYITYHRQT